MSGTHIEFIYDTENYIKPRNPGIKVKEIKTTDPIADVCLNKVYSYSGCKQDVLFPYESQMFVDYSINVAPEVAQSYVKRHTILSLLFMGMNPDGRHYIGI